MMQGFTRLHQIFNQSLTSRMAAYKRFSLASDGRLPNSERRTGVMGVPW
jgi:hypothetical protein